MARIREIDEDGGDPILSELFKGERERFGDLLNPTKIMAHCPPLIPAVRAVGAAIDRAGNLPPGLVALVSLRVATINGCPF